MPLTGDGYFAGEFPGGTTTVEGAPVSATVLVYQRDSGQLIAQTESSPSGEWQITGVDISKAHDIVGRKDGFNDVIVSNVSPTSMVEITYSGAVIENETFTGAVGFLELVGGLPPYSVAAETPFPSGLFPVVSGRNLIIDGTTEDDEVASFDVKVTSSNGAEKIIPLQLVVGFKAPANFKAETVVVDDVFSVSLTWETANSTQQIKVYRSATPFDLDDLPEPIAMLSGTSTTYTDDDVIEDDHFYYMVTAISEQYELRSEVVVEDVGGIEDPHWDNVVALLHFDGDLTDERGNSWSTRGGDPIVSSGLFGGAALFGGDSTKVVQTSLVTTPFDGMGVTLEVHAKSNGTPARNATIMSLSNLRGIANTHSSVAFLEMTSGEIVVDIWDANGVERLAYSGTYLSTTEYKHIALCLLSGTASLYVSGILVGSVAYPISSAQTNIMTLGGMGLFVTSDANLRTTTCYLDDARITVGVARYTENFMPPTEPFPNK